MYWGHKHFPEICHGGTILGRLLIVSDLRDIIYWRKNGKTVSHWATFSFLKFLVKHVRLPVKDLSKEDLVFVLWEIGLLFQILLAYCFYSRPYSANLAPKVALTKNSSSTNV